MARSKGLVVLPCGHQSAGTWGTSGCGSGQTLASWLRGPCAAHGAGPPLPAPRFAAAELQGRGAGEAAAWAARKNPTHPCPPSWLLGPLFLQPRGWGMAAVPGEGPLVGPKPSLSAGEPHVGLVPAPAGSPGLPGSPPPPPCAQAGFVVVMTLFPNSLLRQQCKPVVKRTLHDGHSQTEAKLG